ncbi:hypothetical protein OEZ85_000438 [Tetradesmus obliquus]|uniref:ShKT domain-containing protein n=1 Tax=Tetradesmus obliquus TaxID=3088 RepID=A0ABY8UI37_TETOB|nr:hypothetical protein OEZ85_000438 [Tetradesmus obliquus]
MTVARLVRSLLLLCCFSAGEPTTANTAASSSGTAKSSSIRQPTWGTGRQNRHADIRPRHTTATAQRLLADYYAGKLRPALPAAVGKVIREASAQQYAWAKPEWGRYRRRAVVLADPAGAGEFAIWAWDIVPEAAVQQALRVLSGMVGELAPDIRQRLVSGVQPSKVALFKRPEQVWTDIPEHSIWKGTEFGANDWLSGVGGTRAVPVSSSDTRNVMEAADDPYREESVLVHEFGHHIHNLVLPDCVARAADVAHAHAVASGSYSPGRYMVSSVFEHMANGAAAWFQGTCRSDVNDGIISRPRLLARDPTLFSLMQYIFTPSVARMRYRSLCPACSTKWSPEAAVPLLEPGPPAPLIKLPLDQCISAASSWRPVPRNAPDCSDMKSECRARAIAGQCDTHPDMLTLCQLSCGVCRQVSSSPGCLDRNASCFVAASVQGRCQSDAAGMGPQGMGCLLSCGNCTAARI